MRKEWRGQEAGRSVAVGGLGIWQRGMMRFTDCLRVCLQWLKVTTDVCNHLSLFFPLLPSCPFTPTHSVCHFPLPSSSSLWCFTGTDAGYWAPVLAGCPCSRAANQIAVPELFTQVHLHTGIYVCLSHTHVKHSHCVPVWVQVKVKGWCSVMALSCRLSYTV